jgi:hypothetical protein
VIPAPLQRLVSHTTLPSSPSSSPSPVVVGAGTLHVAASVASACVYRKPEVWAGWLAAWLRCDTANGEDWRAHAVDFRALAQLVFLSPPIFTASVRTLLAQPPAHIDRLLTHVGVDEELAQQLCAEIFARLHHLCSADIGPFFCYLDECRDPVRHATLSRVTGALLRLTTKQVSSVCVVYLVYIWWCT